MSDPTPDPLWARIFRALFPKRGPRALPPDRRSALLDRIRSDASVQEAIELLYETHTFDVVRAYILALVPTT